jgi:hypothetical protein
MWSREPGLPGRASAALFAAGRPGKKVPGRVHASTAGTPSTPAEFAPHACISGLRRSAFPAIAGRRIPPGMSIENVETQLTRSKGSGRKQRARVAMICVMFVARVGSAATQSLRERIAQALWKVRWK